MRGLVLPPDKTGSHQIRMESLDGQVELKKVSLWPTKKELWALVSGPKGGSQG